MPFTYLYQIESESLLKNTGELLKNNAVEALSQYLFDMQLKNKTLTFESNNFSRSMVNTVRLGNIDRNII